MPAVVLSAINFAISLAGITILFALIFRYVPARKIAWKDAWIGASVTGLLFTIGKLLIGLYLGKAAVGSAYGAAGSLVVVVVWGLLFSDDFSIWSRVHPCRGRGCARLINFFARLLSKAARAQCGCGGHRVKKGTTGKFRDRHNDWLCICSSLQPTSWDL